ncbi:MAG: TrpB-like pyridoxal-phosphate dependent enzyme, partial [Chloroflexi bacterium]|nr:TrpB-like pyridoxal-phosphate dependent enzyme [Chloroflexota bacterium]
AVNQKSTFESAIQFARTEGIIPAPEPSHAIKVTIDEALKCKESGQKKVIVLGLSGHGHFDLSAYEQFLSGKLEADAYDEAKVKQALAQLPKIDYVAPK